jgi:hypothetical protein
VFGERIDATHITAHECTTYSRSVSSRVVTLDGMQHAFSPSMNDLEGATSDDVATSTATIATEGDAPSALVATNEGDAWSVIAAELAGDARPRHINSSDATTGQPIVARVLARKAELEALLDQLPEGDLGTQGDIYLALSTINDLLTGDLEHVPPVVVANMNRWLERNKHLAERADTP